MKATRQFLVLFAVWVLTNTQEFIVMTFSFLVHCEFDGLLEGYWISFNKLNNRNQSRLCIILTTTIWLISHQHFLPVRNTPAVVSILYFKSFYSVSISFCILPFHSYKGGETSTSAIKYGVFIPLFGANATEKGFPAPTLSDA